MTTPITKEQLREYTEKKVNSLKFAITQSAFTGITEGLEKELQLAEFALAAMDAEPVASCIVEDGSMCVDGFGEYGNHSLADGAHELYTAPPAPVVPEAIEPDYEAIKSILPNANPDEYACCIAADMWNACRATMLQSFGNSEQLIKHKSSNIASTEAASGEEIKQPASNEPVSQSYKLAQETGASLQLRNLIRKRHAEWSDATFGNVGPIGPLKHLSKEALEAAAEPDDLSEWADMQFLLWDAQRRAGICDSEITAAMDEKLKVNMAREWPEPRDGEPRMHIKEAGNYPVIPDGYALVPIEPTESMIINGFESEPDEFFSKSEVWEEYQKMSGCEQAAHRAKLCWAAMLAAAPNQETKQ